MRYRGVTHSSASLRTLCVLTTLLALLFSPAAGADIRLCTYNLLNFNGDSSRWADYQLILSAVNPDVLVVQEITSSGAVSIFRDSVLNATGGPGESDPYSSQYISDSATQDQAIFYKTSKVVFVSSSVINTEPRDTYRWKLRPASQPAGTNEFYVYTMHLKAGSDPTDQADRLAQTTTIRSNANALPDGSLMFFCGDFNIQSSSEASYQQLVGSQADNSGRAFDPINTPGTWNNVGGFANVHTQSTRGGFEGGLDDRFDFVLVSAALLDDTGMDYIDDPAHTYNEFGNDGLHFNKAISDTPVIPEGSAMAMALYNASDHLPVYLDLIDPGGPVNPPQIGDIPVVNFGQLLVGGQLDEVITVENTATAPAEDLEYSFVAPTGFTAPAGTFTDPVAPGGNQHTITITGLAMGNQFGNLEVNNNSVNDPDKTVFVIGGVLDHAVPSTTSTGQTTSDNLDFGTHALGGFSNQTATIYNADYDPSWSVPLEVYTYQVSGDDAARFDIVGFTVTAGITTSADFTVSFDDTGAAPGAYTATLEFLTRDDSTLAGNMDLATITFNLSASVEGALRGDFDGMNGVDSADIAPFVTVLLDPDGASSGDQWTADMNEDEVNDALDIQPFVDALLQ